MGSQCFYHITVLMGLVCALELICLFCLTNTICSENYHQGLSGLYFSFPTRGLATYASSMSFGHTEHCFLTVWTPKSLGQDLLMTTILEDSACSVTPTIQTKQLLAQKRKLCRYIGFISLVVWTLYTLWTPKSL